MPSVYKITVTRNGQATLVVDSNPAQQKGDLHPNPGGQVLTASLPKLFITALSAWPPLSRSKR